MSTPTPPTIVEAFAINGTKNVIPVDSQIPVTPGAASFNDGFPPLCMTPLTSGGIPPSGADMNGILNMMSAVLAWIQAGGQAQFSAAVVATWTGYAVGAILRSVAYPGQFYYNTVDGNPNDPDIDSTNWIPFNPLSVPANATGDAPVSGGTFNDVNMFPTTGFFDINTDPGNMTYTGFVAGTDGQIVVVTNTGNNLLTLAALNTGSAAANRIRLPSDLTFTKNDGLALRYSAQIGKWTRM